MVGQKISFWEHCYQRDYLLTQFYSNVCVNHRALHDHHLYHCCSDRLLTYEMNFCIIRLWSHIVGRRHRQPKHTMCGFGLQRSFGLNILELLVYYLMPHKCKNLKDIWSLLVCLSVLVVFKIMKVDISCIIACDSGPYCSNFITC